MEDRVDRTGAVNLKVQNLSRWFRMINGSDCQVAGYQIVPSTTSPKVIRAPVSEIRLSTDS